MSYLRANSADADKIAGLIKVRTVKAGATYYADAGDQRAHVRDYCDIHMGGDMTAHQLDLLTDMVMRRLPVYA